MSSRAYLEALREKLGSRLAEIADLCTEPVKLTLLIRCPSHPDGSRDICLTDDNTEAAIAAIRQVERTGEHTPAVKR